MSEPEPFEGESEHPEDYDGPCGCDLCRSYGAGEHERELWPGVAEE